MVRACHLTLIIRARYVATVHALLASMQLNASCRFCTGVCRLGHARAYSWVDPTAVQGLKL